jgi:hypothetical protein
MSDGLLRYKPALPKRYLYIVSALFWAIAGAALCRVALSWYVALGLNLSIPYILMGLLLTIPIHFLGFSTFAKRNVIRIRRLPKRPCLFAWMAWWSYPLVAFMISLGIVLRHSFLPKSYLGILYLGIGGGLILASSTYLKSHQKPSGGGSVLAGR